VLIEHGLSSVVPGYCAVRTVDATYVRYATGEQELYLLGPDPYQLVNQAANPQYESLRQQLRARAEALCSPPPPGFSWTSTVSTALRGDTPVG